MDGLTVVAGLLMLVGLIGIAVPVLPGLVLVWAAVLIWAVAIRTSAGWVVLGIAAVLALCGLLQYLLPGRRLRTAGVTTTATMTGAALAVVGFFVVPVVGAFLGFALGVYLAERAKRGDHTNGVVVDQARAQSHRAEHLYRAGHRSDDCCHLGGCRHHNDLTHATTSATRLPDQSGEQEVLQRRGEPWSRSVVPTSVPALLDPAHERLLRPGTFGCLARLA